MSMEVLQDRSEIRRSRSELKRMGLSYVAPALNRLIARIGGRSSIRVGDNTKSWDVLRTLEFVKRNVARDQPVLDIGCYASEILLALRGSGYRDLTGADLNPGIRAMPHCDEIRYEVTDFMHTNFADASFAAVTSISVIEHGFDQPSLLKEMSRLLRPGGFFVASFDYWPEKIDTTGVRFFDADWKIFSWKEVDGFLRAAAQHDLHPAGTLNSAATDKVIKCAGKEYTFAWVVLQKSL